MKLAVMLFAILVSASCATTAVSSLTAPDRNGEQFRHILVNLPTGNIDWKRTTEDAFVSGDSAFVASYKLFYPGRSYSQREIEEIDRANHIDALLVIAIAQTGISTVSVPIQTNTSCVATSDGSNAAAGCASSQSGGQTSNRPWANWSAKMWSLGTGRVVWIASSSSSGTGYNDWHDIMNSMVSCTIDKMREDSLIASPRHSMLGFTTENCD